MFLQTIYIMMTAQTLDNTMMLPLIYVHCYYVWINDDIHSCNPVTFEYCLSRYCAWYLFLCHSIDSSKCHRISKIDVKVLVDYLAQINRHWDEICDYLAIKNCVGLKNDNNRTPFHLAKHYYTQQYECCWEDVVKLLCHFNEGRLARQLAEEKDIIFKEQCPNYS